MLPETAAMIREFFPDQFDLLSNVIRSGYHLRGNAQKAEDLELGASRLGGVPDLPSDTAWPVSAQGEPLAFLGQIHVNDCPGWAGNGCAWSGGLALFLDVANEVSGCSWREFAGWRVVRLPDAELVRRDFPDALAADSRFACVGLRAEACDTLPDREEWASVGPELDGQRLEEMRDRLGNPTNGHRLLGHASYLQGPVDIRRRYWLQREGRTTRHPFSGEEIVVGRQPSDALTPQIEQLLSPDRPWRCLLQIDSDPTVGFRWFDTGRLYLMMPEESLRRGHFDDVWLETQFL